MSKQLEESDFEIIEVPLAEAMDVDDEESDVPDFMTSAESKLHQDYIQGLITFTEYSSKWEDLLRKYGISHLNEDDTEQIESSEVVVISPDDVEKDKVKTQSESKKKDKNKVKIPRPRVKLPKPLLGLLGQASVKFARKTDQQGAIETVLDVLRQCPMSAEPYKALSSMYEELGDKEKSFEMLFFGAHLGNDNADEWVRLGKHFEKVNNKREAIRCYSKALKADVSLLNIHERRAELCDEIDLKNRNFILAVLAGYVRFLKNVNEFSDKYAVLQISKKTAKIYHEAKDYKKAADALKTAFVFCKDTIQPEDINLYLELLLILKDFKTCLDIFINFCNLELKYKITHSNLGDEIIDVESCTCWHQLDTIQPEILSKLIIVLIHIRSEVHFSKFLSSLSFDLNQYGDLCVDISDALMKEDYHSYSIDILNQLIAGEKYNLPGVWKQLAESYEHIGDIEQCKIAYRKVIEKAPLYIEVRRHLRDIYLKENNTKEAINVLRQNTSGACLVSAKQLVDQLVLMMEDPVYDREFTSLLSVLLSQHSIELKTRHELKMIISRLKYARKVETVHNLRGHGKDVILDNREMFSDEVPSFEVTNMLYRHAVDHVVKRTKDYRSLQKIIVQAFSSSVLATSANSQYMDQLSMDAVTCFYQLDQLDICYNLLRLVLLKYLESKVILNIMNVLLMRYTDSKYIRNMLRLFHSKPNLLGLNVMYANNCIMTGNYKYCVNEYAMISSNFQHSHPLYLLDLAIAYAGITTQKFMDKKPLLVVHGLAFMSKYKAARGSCMLQEVYYNLARFYHQIGMLTNAVNFYNQALNTSPCLPQYDLKYEIAYNLCVAYNQSRSPLLARYILNKYLIM